MEEQQTTPVQPSVTPTPSKRFPRKKLILGLFVLLVVGGAGSVLAWRTTYLDNYLPAGVREFFGRGEEVGEEEEEPVPPIISSVKASNITETGATITWTTDVEATSRVEYGTTTDYGSQTTEDSTLVVSHSVALTGLTKGTLYHYRVKSESAEGGLAISEDYTLTTKDPTKGWKTYTNTKYGYSIKYPPTWLYSGSKGTPAASAAQVVFDAKKEDLSAPAMEAHAIVITVAELARGSTQIPPSLLECEPVYDEEVECERKAITIGGMQGVQIDYLVGGGLHLHSYVFQSEAASHPPRVWSFALQKKAEYREVYDLMLSTFKFL